MKPSKNRDIRVNNLMSILSCILQRGDITKREIQKITSLSWASVSTGVKDLVNKGILVLSKSTEGDYKGRFPEIVKMRENRVLFAGIDMIRSGLRGVLTDLNRNTVFESHTSLMEDTKEAFFEKIFKMVNLLLDKAKELNGKVLSIGASVQGRVNSKTGVSVYMAGFKDGEWRNVPIRQILEDRYGLPVVIEHDPQCALHDALNQYPADNAVLIRWGFGAGMALCLDGVILGGEWRYEIGDIVISADWSEDSVKTSIVQDTMSILGFSLPTGKDYEYVIKHLDEFPELWKKETDVLAVIIYNNYVLYCCPVVILTGILAVKKEFYFERLKKRLSLLLKHNVDEVMTIKVFSDDDAAAGASSMAMSMGLERFLSE